MRSGTKRERGRPSRPGIEALEGRAVPATFHAANTAQLFADIAAVGNTSGPNTIELAPGSYSVANALPIENAGDLTIIGSTQDAGSNLYGRGVDRMIEVDGGKLTLSGLTITGGGDVNQGGAIYAHDADLTINNCAITGNSAKQMGGAIYAEGGTLNLDQTQVVLNSASGGPDCFGGGIATSNAQVTITRSAINNNAASSPDTGPQGAALDIGGGLYVDGGTLTIANNSSITNNRAWAITNGPSAFDAGGGIASSNAIVSVSGSTIGKNTVSGDASRGFFSQGSDFATLGGSLTVSSSKLSRDSLNANGEFYHPGASVVLKSSTVGGRKFPGTYTLGDLGFTPEH